MAWDSGNNNTWSSTRLNTGTLNGTYLSGLGTWANMIAEHEWKVGGMAWSNSNTAKQYYATELGNSDGNSITYRAKIGLMYVSDYGYAASPANWSTNMESLNNATNRDNNWMFMGLYEWTISHYSDITYGAFVINYTGYVYSYHVYGDYGRTAVRPSFYLESSVVLTGGTGTASDPYRIS